MTKKTNPLVSTLICTYNAEKFIDNTLDSVLNQTYRDQEILIRDDGSKDNTIEVLKNIAKKDKRIHIFTSKEL
jgi:glycosyltransferase involved in cell wall biosynthesis